MDSNLEDSRRVNRLYNLIDGEIVGENPQGLCLQDDGAKIKDLSMLILCPCSKCADQGD